MKAFERFLLNTMISSAVLPIEGIFQISELMLAEYIRLYGVYFKSKDTVGLRNKSNSRFARRLAGLTLLKLNFERGAKFNQINAGIVYLISNPSFPEHYKIGLTVDLPGRLESYQTYDPYRNFVVEKYSFVINRVDVERQLLCHPDIFKENGEWVKKENATKIFERICFYSGIKNKNK